MELLELTWGRILRVWWSWLWRHVLVLIGVMVIGGLLGGLIGIVMGSMGYSGELVESVATLLGGALGIFSSVIPLGLILNSRIGGMRLVLVRGDGPAIETAIPYDN